MIAVNINAWPTSWLEAWSVAQRDLNQEQLAAMLDLAAEIWPGNVLTPLPSSLQHLGIDEAVFELLKPVLSTAQLRASCSLNYLVRLKLLDSSAKEIRLVGDLPSRIFRCINDLPPLSAAFVNFRCDLLYAISHPAAIANFLRDQTDITSISLEYGGDEWDYLVDAHLVYAMEHILGSIPPSCTSLALVSCPSQPLIPRFNPHKDPKRLFQVAGNTPSPIRQFTLPVAWLRDDAIALLFAPVLYSSVLEDMSIQNIASQDDVDRLLLLAPKSLKKLAISIDSARPFPTRDTCLDQYVQLESFSYLGGSSTASKFLVLPPLRELELTSSFSFISMVNGSQLERLSIKPAPLSVQPWSSGFCSEMDALLNLLVMGGRLARGDLSLSITLPRYLDDHLHQVSANGLNCTCLHKLYQLSTMSAVTTLSFQVHECSEIVHEHILE